MEEKKPQLPSKEGKGAEQNKCLNNCLKMVELLRFMSTLEKKDVKKI